MIDREGARHCHGCTMDRCVYVTVPAMMHMSNDDDARARNKDTASGSPCIPCTIVSEMFITFK